VTTGAVSAAPAPTPAAPWRFGLVAAAGAIGTSSVAPALNDIAAALSLGAAATAGVLSAYAVPYAASIIVAAQLCDTRGPRAVLRVALVVGIVGAVLAAAAPSGVALLAGRAVQGLGAGAATMAAFDVARRLPAGIARAAAVLTLGASSGPVLGGLAADSVGWQLAVLLPGLLHLTGIVGLHAPRTGGGTQTRVDGPGLLATGVGAAATASGLQLIQLAPTVAAVLVVLGLGLLAAASRRSVVGPGRVPPEALLVVPQLRRSGALAFAIAATYFSTLVVVPVALGRIGVSALGIGALLLPPAFSGAVAARWSAVITGRLGRWTEPVAATATVSVLLVVLVAPPVLATLSLFALAGAYGIIQPPLLEAVSSAVDDGPATAIGAANLVLLLGGGVGSAVVGGLGARGGGLVLLVMALAVSTVVFRAAAAAGRSGSPG
jgi:MFS family permease